MTFAVARTMPTAREVCSSKCHSQKLRSIAKAIELTVIRAIVMKRT